MHPRVGLTVPIVKAHEGKRLPGAYWEDRIFEDYRPIEERALHRMADIAILSTKSEHTMEQIRASLTAAFYSD
jgi:hypothetical protein